MKTDLICPFCKRSFEFHFQNLDNRSIVTDVDSNVYKTVMIGNQLWMAENLVVTRYRNGDLIQNVTSNSEWTKLSTGAWCNYDNNVSNADVYGKLYNWYAVNDSRGLAPEGWHVPTEEEWKQLEMTLGMSRSEADYPGWRGTNEGSKLAGNTSLWESGILEANSEFGESGFSALPGGFRDGLGADYYYLSKYAYFWSSTENGSNHAWSRYLYYYSPDVHRLDSNKHYGLSVRCVRD